MENQYAGLEHRKLTMSNTGKSVNRPVETRRWSKIRIIGTLEQRRENGAGAMFEEMLDENFPKLRRTLNHPFETLYEAKANEVQATTLRDSIMKLLKTNDRETILKAVRKKKKRHITFKRTTMRLMAGFLNYAKANSDQMEWRPSLMYLRGI